MYEERDIVVETLEYRKARAPHRLIANLEPCIGIGSIYGDRGCLLHTQPVGWEGRFPEEIRPILRDLRRLKTKPDIYIAGCFRDGSYDEEMMRGREVVLEEISKFGLEDCLKEVRWARNLPQVLTLDLAQGIGIIEDQEDFYDDERFTQMTRY